ncbi:MAG: hypothetical protein A2260_01500 [Candidatus Komeilibacteria bacterium RIFOXYA2_FULL_45_9]|nr:MAG: hypothetical protein A2260_01500 [Candidatus Komeilibacteria bacterium RIFOXYA2_FULL_45_9]
MIKLNLISPEQQTYLKKHKLYIDIENILGLTVVIAILISIILIPFNNFISVLNDEVNYDREKSAADNRFLTDKVSDLNEKINLLYAIQSDNYNWTELLKVLSGLTPEDVAILEFNGQSTSQQFNLHGFAKTRDIYLKFRGNLEASDYFSNLDFPLTDILKKEDITFTIKGSLK